jgi:diguanylate cyclase (GGDEF)-like protein
MFKSIFGQPLTDLGELEGDYRAYHLKNDIAQSALTISIVVVSILGALGTDAVFFRDRRDLFMLMVCARIIFALICMAAIWALRRTKRVKDYDLLHMGWTLFVIVAITLFKFTRPVNYLTSSFDVIVPLAIYLLSPLKIKHNSILALGFSIGTLYVDFSFGSGLDPLHFNVAVAAQLVVHALGLGSAFQIQTFRRRSFRAYIQEKDAKEVAAYLSNIDPLTHSMTRRHFFSFAGSEFLRYTRYHRPLSVLVIDADHFKNINDTYGHHAGDVVLKSLSLVAMEQKRAQDTFGRLGGEEFGLLLPETNLEQARIVAERIQKTWEQTPSNMDGELIHSTISIGVAETIPTDKSFDDLLRRADRMLYKAKERGRNQVAVE